MGIGTARHFVVALVLAVLIHAQVATAASLVRQLAGVEVDWSAGTVTASAGAAADMRMPSPDAARPGAERRARAAAVEKLRAALPVLCVRGSERLGVKQVDAALARASTIRIEYQSNGGVVLWVQVRFEDLVENASTTPFGGFGTDSPPHLPPRASRAPVAATTTATTTEPFSLAVAAMPLELAPSVLADGKEIVAERVRYHQGPPPADAISVRRDDKGRLVLPKGSQPTLDRLARGSVVIYLQKVLP
jgi:hypothetical protein